MDTLIGWSESLWLVKIDWWMTCNAEEGGKKKTCLNLKPFATFLIWEQTKSGQWCMQKATNVWGWVKQGNYDDDDDDNDDDDDDDDGGDNDDD